MAEGQPPKEVAAQYGMNEHYIRQFCQAAGLAMPTQSKGRPMGKKGLLPATIAKYGGLDWTKQDVILCKVAGVSRERIRQLRLALGKPQSPNYHQNTTLAWREGDLAKLGKYPDWQVAEIIGKSGGSVQYRRNQLGLPAIKRPKRCHIWTPEELALLGQMPDREAARNIGLHWQTLRRKRAALGIPSWRVGVNGGSPLKPGVPKLPHRQWTPREIALLGTMSDYKLADKLGCSNMAVLGERRRQGIPPFKPNHKTLARLKKELADAERTDREDTHPGGNGVQHLRPLEGQVGQGQAAAGNSSSGAARPVPAAPASNSPVCPLRP